MKEVVVEKFAGIDISRETLDVYVDTDKMSWHVAYDEEGMARIVSGLREAAPNLIVMEATGGLEIRLATELAHGGMRKLLTTMNAMLKNNASWCPENA